MEASKWLDLHVLLDSEEMEALFTYLNDQLGTLHLYLPGRVVPTGEGELSQQAYLNSYESYVTALKNGLMPSAPLFTVLLTLSPDHVSILKIDPQRELIRPIKPVVQLQPHSMSYSTQDGKFHSMVFGSHSILWGVQFSYPQLFLDPQNREVLKVNDSFPNTALFRHIQRWIRDHTLPTPMHTPSSFLNLPVRLGKSCLTWINQHPQLKPQQLLCQLK
jgi:hypothetical protein